MIITIDARYGQDEWKDLYVTEDFDDLEAAMNAFKRESGFHYGYQSQLHGSLGIILYDDGYEVRFFEEDEDDYTEDGR